MISQKYKELKLVCHNKVTNKLTELRITPKGLSKITDVDGESVNGVMYIHFKSNKPFDGYDFEMYEWDKGEKANVSDITLDGTLHKFLEPLIIGHYRIDAYCDCDLYELTLSFSCFSKGMEKRYTMNLIFNAQIAPNYNEADECNENEKYYEIQG